MIIADLLEKPCNKPDNLIKVARLRVSGLVQMSIACSKLVDNSGQAVRTQLVDTLFADASFF